MDRLDWRSGSAPYLLIKRAVVAYVMQEFSCVQDLGCLLRAGGLPHQLLALVESFALRRSFHYYANLLPPPPRGDSDSGDKVVGDSGSPVRWCGV